MTQNALPRDLSGLNQCRKLAGGIRLILTAVALREENRFAMVLQDDPQDVREDDIKRQALVGPEPSYRCSAICYSVAMAPERAPSSFSESIA